MSEWIKTELGNLVNRIIGGGTPPRVIGEYWNGEIPWITVKDFNTNTMVLTSSQEKISLEGLNRSSTHLIPKNTLIIGTRINVGHCVICTFDTTINQDLKALFTKDEISRDYLLYFINFHKPKFELIGIGSTVKGISLKDLVNFQVEFPSEVKEQRKIARILSTADAVIEKTRAAIAKYKAVKQGMLHDLFTRGIDPHTGMLRPKPADAPELYRDSPLGKVPKDWEVINFIDAASLITDFTANGSFESLKINVKYYYEPNYARLIRLTDLRVNLTNDGVYVDKEGFEYLRKSAVFENDIMLANVGEYTGFACLMPKVDYPATIAPNMFLIRAQTELFDPLFMYFFMTLDAFTRQVDNVSASSATKLLNKTNFRALKILKPQKTEQQIIGKSLSVIDKKIQTEQSYLAKLQSIKAGLMADLLSGKKPMEIEAPK